jgi:hypothetical protein
MELSCQENARSVALRISSPELLPLANPLPRAPVTRGPRLRASARGALPSRQNHRGLICGTAGGALCGGRGERRLTAGAVRQAQA